MPAEEIKPEIIQKTQKILGKYVKKPVLTERLLAKPPFRFLHDIINAVIKETGFLKDLFSAEQLQSENVKDREAKVAYLNKLIDAVKVITGTELTVRASKIVAGLEPNETNLLLQTIGRAIDKKLDSSEYVKKLQSGLIVPVDKKPRTQEKVDKPKKITSKTSVTSDKAKVKSSPKSNETSKTDKSKAKAKVAKDTKSNEKNSIKGKTVKKETIKETPKNEEIKQVAEETVELQEVKNEENVEKDNKNEQDEEKIEEMPKVRPLTANRPKSARPKSSDKNKEKEESLVDFHSSLRPPSVRPSSARPGAPRLRADSALPFKEVVTMGKINVIVENFDNRNPDEDEDTVVIQNNPEIGDEEEGKIEMETGENKGHLVEQILEQINEKSDKESKNKVEIEWEDGLHSKDATNMELNQLRSSIQSLTKTANPLGKLLNYLHEDIDAMHNELEYWTNIKKQLLSEIQKQKKISVEFDKPLMEHLENLNEEVRKQEEEIVNVRSNILRNEFKIKELLMSK